MPAKRRRVTAVWGVVAIAAIVLGIALVPRARDVSRAAPPGDAPMESVAAPDPDRDQTAGPAEAMLTPAPADTIRPGPMPTPASDMARLTYAVAWNGPLPDEMALFRDWARRYREESDAAAREVLESEGLRLAQARRASMLELIQRDPERALAVTVPEAVRAELPEAVLAQIEARVSGAGDLQLVCVTPVLGSRETARLIRGVHLDGTDLEPHLYGRRASQQTEHGVSLHGVVLDGHLALHESPVRVLEAEEAARVTPASIRSVVSGRELDARQAIAVEYHGRIAWVGDAGELGELEQRLIAAENLPGADAAVVTAADGTVPEVQPAPPTAWTTGMHQLLVVRVDFSDNPGEEMSWQAGNDLINASVSPYYDQASYGVTSLVPTVSEKVYRMPQDAASYTSTNAYNQLYTDATSASAAGADYTIANYQHVMVVFPRITVNNTWSWAGLAQVGGSRSWINGYYDFRVVAHELGHNYGLHHANLWQVRGGDPVSAAGSSIEYGDPFDVMGGSSTLANHHYGPWFKNRLGWLPDSAVTTVTASGTYRITRFDEKTTPLTQPLALSIYRDGARAYWVGYRQNFPTLPSLARGAFVQWGFYTGQGSLLLDMTTPGYDAADAGLAIGSTFTDVDYGITIRPVARGGTAPSEYLDVEVTLTPPPLPVVIGWGQSHAATVPLGLRGVTAITAGSGHALALSIDGTVTGWGLTTYGQATIPALVQPATAVSAGGYTSGVVLADGSVLMWGDNASGQASVPTGLGRVRQLSISGSHTLALRQDGTVAAWGANGGGQCSVPAGLGDVVAVSAGNGRSTALRSDGTVVQWGVNPSPAPAGLSGVTAIAASDLHTLALRSDGTVVAWGNNSYGQIDVPAGLTGVTAIASAPRHSLAVRSDGTVAAWGSNSSGEAAVPAGIPAAVAVAASDACSLVLTATSGVPVVLVQPVGCSVMAGSDATFVTSIYGAPAPALRWERRPVEGGTWSDLADAGPYSGTATRELTVAAATLAMNGDEFRCTATPAGGGPSVATDAVRLTVLPPTPVITSQPAMQIGRLGGGATFSVAATGTGALSYQWLKDGVTIEGATSPSMVIPALTPADAGFYSVVVTDANGATTSHGARLAVHPVQYPDVVTARTANVVRLRARGAVGYAAEAGPDGSVYFGGDFLALGGLARTGVARLAADGTVDAAWVPPAFDHGDVRALALQPDGKLLVGGGFTSADGVAAGGLVRLNTDGSIDTTFSLGGSGFGGVVEHLALHADGRIVVAGTFLNFNGAPATFLVRLHADGSRDTSLPVTGIASGSINSLIAQDDGRIILGGLFSSVAGTVRGRIARLNADGSLDASFAAGAGFNAAVYDIVAAPGGRFLVGGAFSSYDGTPRNGVAMLDANGALDATFDPGSGSNLVRSIGLLSDGRVVVAGLFTTFAGSTQRFYARLTATGALDVSGTLAAALDGSISGLTVLPGDRVIVLGAFRSDGTTRHPGVARIQDRTIEPGYTVEAVQDAVVQSMLPAGDAHWLVAGEFSSADDAVRGSIARLTREGMLDTAWHAGSGFRPTEHVSAANSWVHTLQGLPDGRVAAGGDFQTYQAMPAVGLAFLRADGGFDGSKTVNGTIYCSALQPDGKLLLGGSFTSVAGVSCPRIVRLNRDNSIDSSFVVGTGFSSTVRCLAVQADGAILVGGSFTSYQGVTTPNFARLHPDGSLDVAFSARTGAGATVRAIALQPDGRILVGGAFSTIGATSRARLARLHPDGTVDDTFVPEAATIGAVYELLLQADGRVLVASGCVLSTSGNYGGLVRLEANGARDRTFVVQGVPLVHYQAAFEHLAITPEGRILAGGTRIGPAGSGFLVLEPPGSPPRVTSQPVAQAVSAGGGVTLSVAAESTSGAPLTYQWYRDGVAVRGATASTYHLPSAQAFHAGNYTVVVTSGVASTTSQAVMVTVAPMPTSAARVLNLSTRAHCQTGDNVLIPGFYISGTGTKRLLMRAVGPELAAFGVNGVLADPQMTLYRATDRVVIASNDDWGTDRPEAIRAAGRSIYAFDLAEGSKSAALLVDLPAGGYTIAASGKGDSTGVSIVELYEVSGASETSRLINLSNRGHVGVGGNIMIPGFVVSEEGSRTFLIRVVGPSLAQFGVSGVLVDPKMEIYRRRPGTAIDDLILTNDTWGENGDADAIRTTTDVLHAFRLAEASKDAAFVVTLPSGAYTVNAKGVGDSTGVALVEVYLVP